VKDKFGVINKDFYFVFHELLAIFLNFIWHCCTKHHDLLVVLGLHEYFLDIGSHLWVSNHLITLINNEVLHILRLNCLVFQQVEESPRSSNDNVRGLRFVSKLIHLVIEALSTKVTADS